MRNDILSKNFGVESKSNWLDEMLDGHCTSPAPLSMVAVRRELKKAIWATGKKNLQYLLEQHATIIITTAPFSEMALEKYSVESKTTQLHFSKSFEMKVTEIQKTIAEKIPSSAYYYSEKMRELCVVVAAIAHANVAPANLRIVENLKQLVFDLLLNVRLFMLKVAGYDFSEHPICCFLLECSGGTQKICPVVDPAHVMKRIVVNFSEFCGADSEHWADLADDPKSKFPVDWYFRDKQSVDIATLFFSEQTEYELKAAGHITSAQFCSKIRLLWQIWDDDSMIPAVKLKECENVHFCFNISLETTFIRNFISFSMADTMQQRQKHYHSP